MEVTVFGITNGSATFAGTATRVVLFLSNKAPDADEKLLLSASTEILARLVQPTKTEVPMLLTYLGIARLVRLLQPCSA
jgi:hypothetical protein